MGGAAKALRTPKQDEFRSAVGILDNLAIPQAHDGPALLLQIGRSPSVASDRRRVLAAIDFDRQPSFSAGKIHDVRPNH